MENSELTFETLSELFPNVYLINSSKEHDFMFLTDHMGFLLPFDETKELIYGLQRFVKLFDKDSIEKYNEQLLNEYYAPKKIVHKKPKRKQPQTGYIYFISDDKKRIKIGKTIQLKERLGEYTKLAFEPKLIHYFKTNNYHEIETFIHEHFKDKRIRGEWFALSNEDIESIKSGKLEEMINNEYF